jgi:hypothetical protein
LYVSGISELQAVIWMGHKDSKMIREVYAHLNKKQQTKNASGFREYLSKHSITISGEAK